MIVRLISRLFDRPRPGRCRVCGGVRVTQAGLCGACFRAAKKNFAARPKRA